MFSGLKAFMECLKRKIPMSYFREWLRAKWRADLKAVAWAIPMLPFICLWAVGAALMIAGSILLATKEILPSWCLLPANLRDEQIKIVDAVKILIRERDAAQEPHTPEQEKTPTG